MFIALEFDSVVGSVYANVSSYLSSGQAPTMTVRIAHEEMHNQCIFLHMFSTLGSSNHRCLCHWTESTFFFYNTCFTIITNKKKSTIFQYYSFQGEHIEHICKYVHTRLIRHAHSRVDDDDDFTSRESFIAGRSADDSSLVDFARLKRLRSSCRATYDTFTGLRMTKRCLLLVARGALWLSDRSSVENN